MTRDIYRSAWFRARERQRGGSFNLLAWLRRLIQSNKGKL